jgi:hypothetical protein
MKYDFSFDASRNVHSKKDFLLERSCMYGVHECICMLHCTLQCCTYYHVPTVDLSSTKPLPARLLLSSIQQDIIIFGSRQVNDDCCIHR